MAVVDELAVTIDSTNDQADRPGASAYFRWKGWIDRILAGIMLFPVLPLIGVLVVVVRLSSRGPGIFCQVRVGLNGRLFTMYKLRTMRVDAEAKTGAVWCKTNDPRITRLGSLLRRLHLDELPQLFNVLRGEMSLVGPRPERPEFVEVLADSIPGYLHRHDVPPGVTGLAQVNLPPDTDLNSVRRKLVLDLEYVRTGSFLLDIRLLACTALRLVGLRYGRSVKLLGLGRIVVLPDDVDDADQTSSNATCNVVEATEAKPAVKHAPPHETVRIATSDTIEAPAQAESSKHNNRQQEVLDGTPDAVVRVMARRPR